MASDPEAAAPAAVSARERQILDRALREADHADLFEERLLSLTLGPAGRQALLADGRAERALLHVGPERLVAMAPGARHLEPFRESDRLDLEARAEELWRQVEEGGREPVRVSLLRRRVRVTTREAAFEREERRVEVEVRGPSGLSLRVALDPERFDLGPEEPANPPPARPGRALALLGPQPAGVLFHELVGHGLEYGPAAEPPHLAPGLRVGPPALNVDDDPTRPGLAASFAVDDEGSPTDRVALLRDGRVCGHLADRRALRLHRGARPGHARRMSFRDLPLPRSGNLVVLPDPSGRAIRPGHPDASVEVRRVAAGEARLDGTGARLLAHRILAAGEVTGPAWLHVSLDALRGARLGAETRTDPLALCGRDGQEVPVSITAPHLLVELTLEPL